MKRIKKLASLFLAMVMVLAMAIPAMAAESADGKRTVTVTLPGDGTILKDHVFKAYQVFTGTQGANTGVNQPDEDILGDIAWGDGINHTAFVDALKASNKLGDANPFADCADDAAAVAKIISENVTLAEKVAQIAYDHKTGEGVVLASGANRLAAGYYLIVDSTVAQGGGQVDVYNAALLQATTNVEVQVKTDKPTITKKIKENENTTSDYNTAAIGDTVTYQLDTKVPDMSHYENYKFMITDKLSKGLTLDADSVAIKIDGVADPLDVDKDYVVRAANPATDTNGNQYYEILFLDFYQKWMSYPNAAMTVTYNATINANANIGTIGNDNDVKLTYSSNPNEVGEGDEFGPGDVKGDTPWDKVITYVVGINLNKVDGEDTTKTLTGAQFKITGTGLLNQALVVGYEFVENTTNAATYYRLNDGSYTEVAPTDATKDQYTTYAGKKYEKVEKTGVTTEVSDVATDYIAEVNGDGVLKLSGLKAGTYTIEEIKAPAGYNLLTDDLVVQIRCSLTDADAKKLESGEAVNCVWEVSRDAGTTWTQVGNEGVFEIDVENNRGSLLPSTGGIGTTIFYVVGGILVVAAGILLVTKKRMSAR